MPRFADGKEYSEEELAKALESLKDAPVINVDAFGMMTLSQQFSEIEKTMNRVTHVLCGASTHALVKELQRFDQGYIWGAETSLRPEVPDDEIWLVSMDARPVLVRKMVGVKKSG